MIGGGSGGGAAPTPVAKARAERAGGHLAEAGNIESLGGREHVVDAPTNGIVRRIIELHVLHLVVRLEHGVGGGSCSSASGPCSLHARSLLHVLAGVLPLGWRAGGMNKLLRVHACRTRFEP